MSTPGTQLVQKIEKENYGEKAPQWIKIFTGFCKKSQLTEDQLTLAGDKFALLLSITVHSVHFLGLRIFLEGHTFCGGLL